MTTVHGLATVYTKTENTVYSIIIEHFNFNLTTLCLYPKSTSYPSDIGH